MARHVTRNGAEYTQQTVMDLQDFQASARLKASICRSKMNKLRDKLHRMDLTSNNPWKDPTMEFSCLKEDKF